tara:strand:- start:594 stop:1259 length:666 start_codon:yes stop_codon:yes gene_type:complete
MLSQEKIWDDSYKNKDNFLLYPSEHVVRFFNNFIYKIKDFKVTDTKLNVLDLGCGVGRHLVFFGKKKCDIIGYDISIEALRLAKENLEINELKKFKLTNNLESENIKNNNIDVVVCHGVLDSMSEEDAKKNIQYVKLKLKKNGLFYVEVIGKKTSKPKSSKLSNDSYLIKTKHEYNTIQSYFDDDKIKKYFKDFTILKKYTVTEKNKKNVYEQYILIMKKK